MDSGKADNGFVRNGRGPELDEGTLARYRSLVQLIASDPMSAPIRLDIRGTIAELILDRPEKRNALSHVMWSRIPELISNAVANTSVKVLIVHGGSSGAFAAGQDIAEFDSQYATREGASEAGEAIATALAAIAECEKPVIAAIDGACVGGGMSLALACDLRIASENARFGITPAKLGLVYPPADMALLLRQVSPSIAKDLLFTARILDAPEARTIGLIDRLVEGDVMNAARRCAEDIASVSQWSVRAIKKMVAGMVSGWTPDTPQAIELFLSGFENDDHKEGYQAFLEKRRPQFPIR